MKRPWWMRWLTPGAAKRQTDQTLAEVRRALDRLDHALSTVEVTKRRRWPNDGQ